MRKEKGRWIFTWIFI